MTQCLKADDRAEPDVTWSARVVGGEPGLGPLLRVDACGEVS